MKIYQLEDNLLTETQASDIIKNNQSEIDENYIKEFFNAINIKSYDLSQNDLLYVMNSNIYSNDELLQYVRDELSNKNVWYVDITDIYEALHFLETFENQEIITYIYKNDGLYNKSDLIFDVHEAKNVSNNFTNYNELEHYLDYILIESNKNNTKTKLENAYQTYKELEYDNLITIINKHLTTEDVTCPICHHKVQYNTKLAMSDYIKNEFLWCDTCNEPRKHYFLGLASLVFSIFKDELSDITNKLITIDNGIQYVNQYV